MAVHLGRGPRREAEGGIGEVRAEPLQLDAERAARWLQVDERGHLVDDRVVVVRRLAREPVQVVPRAGERPVGAFPERADVAGAGDALVHEAEDAVVETLDPRLDVHRSRAGQERQLVRVEVGLDLVVHQEVPAAVGGERQEVREVRHVDDVVDRDDVEDPVPPDEPVDFGPQLLTGLGAERHRRAVETAERAVVLLAPPAAACAFHDQFRTDVLGHRGGVELRLPDVVVGRGDVTRRHRTAGLLVRPRGPAVPPAQARYVDGRGPGVQMGQQGGERVLPSPRTTWSTKGWLRCRAWPIGPSQLLPPKTTVRPGRRRLSSAASASEDTFCMNVLVNPTTSGSSSRISEALRAMKSAAWTRMACALSTGIPRRRAYAPSRATPQSGSA